MKLPLSGSFARLCGFIGTLHEGLNILAAGKADVCGVISFTIPSTGWGTDNSVPSHPYYHDFTVTGLLASDIVNVCVAPADAESAACANFTVTQSYAGKFRLRCKNVPEAAISAEYHITNTAEYAT